MPTSRRAPLSCEGDAHPEACQALGEPQDTREFSFSLSPHPTPPRVSGGGTFTRRSSPPQQLTSPQGGYFHPLPCARILPQLPILSLADNPSHQPPSSSSCGHPGRTGLLMPLFLLPAQGGHMAICKAAPPLQLAPGILPASAPLSRGQSGHPTAFRLGPSSFSSGIAWPKPLWQALLHLL